MIITSFFLLVLLCLFRALVAAFITFCLLWDMYPPRQTPQRKNQLAHSYLWKLSQITSEAQVCGNVFLVPTWPTIIHIATVSTNVRMTHLSFVREATQAKAPSRDCGVCTLTFPLDSPILFLQPTIVKRPSKRPRLSHTDEEEGPSEWSSSMLGHEPAD